MQHHKSFSQFSELPEEIQHDIFDYYYQEDL